MKEVLANKFAGLFETSFSFFTLFKLFCEPNSVPRLMVVLRDAFHPKSMMAYPDLALTEMAIHRFKH